MKYKLLLLIICGSLFISCQKKTAVPETLIYEYDDNVYIKDSITKIDSGVCVLSDGSNQDCWLVSVEQKRFRFNSYKTGQVKEISFVDGKPSLLDIYYFMNDNIVIVREETLEGLSFYRIDLLKETSELFHFKDIKGYKICGVESNNLILYSFVDEKIVLFDYVDSVFNQLPFQLKNMCYSPTNNMFVGLNDKNYICFLNHKTSELKVLKVKGVINNTEGDINTKYLVTKDYLYFSKINNTYKIKHCFSIFILGFLPWKGDFPRKWYRLNLSTGDVERIDFNEPFVKLHGSL